jgi:hypothetical protein
MDVSEAQLSWIMGCVFLLALVLGWPALTTALALIREERLLGKIYWYWQVWLEARRRKT